MSGFDTRLERLELKYLVDERTAARIRHEIEPYCEADRYSVYALSGQGERGYAISSLYLDSPGLAFHTAKERGDSDRIKLRVRTYDAESPAVLEIKRRSADVVDKRRARVPRDAVERIVQGFHTDALEDLESERHAEQFALLAAKYGAEPSLRVRYRREAYVSEVDQYARVTFDRHIEVQRARSWSLDHDPDGWCAFDRRWQPHQVISNVVLEIKCHRAVPFWISELIQVNRLIRSSFSKYSIGIHVTDRESGLGGLMRRSARVMM